MPVAAVAAVAAPEAVAVVAPAAAVVGRTLLINAAFGGAVSLIGSVLPGKDESLKEQAEGALQAAVVGAVVGAAAPEANVLQQIPVSFLANVAISQKTGVTTPAGHGFQLAKNLYAEGKIEKAAKVAKEQRDTLERLVHNKRRPADPVRMIMPEVPEVPSGYPYDTPLFAEFYQRAIDAWHTFVDEVTAAMQEASGEGPTSTFAAARAAGEAAAMAAIQ